MSYQVLARRWRPQRFEDVVGQETVTRTLQNAIKSGRIAHAFLFSGVRGVGKTTTARILAKALNCQKGPTPLPCGECVSCTEIAAANSLEVLEIDAASNTGVDSIRELRESVRYGTARDRFKIFIIDEVHMLSNAAFNALLKTLEEPPSHVKFILATTEYHKIPATITSRCQQFEFKPISFQLILQRLKLICKEEGIDLSEYGLRAIVASAQGSMRDAQSTLDQIVAFSGKNISDDDVRTLLGMVDERALLDLVDAVASRDRKRLIGQVQELKGTGVDPHNFCRKLIQHVRNLLVCKAAGWDEQLLNLPDAEKDAIVSQAEQFSELDLIRFYDVLNRTENELRWHSHPYVHLEMTLVKLAELAQLPALEEVISRLESPEGFRVSRSPSPASAPQTRTLFEGAGETVPQPQEETRTEQPPHRTGAKENQAVNHLLAAVQMENVPLYASLQHASRITLANGKLSIVFPNTEAFHRNIVLAPENRQGLVRLCARLTGSDPEVEAIVEDEVKEKKSSDPTQNPKVKAFIETFPGKVIVEKKGEN